MSNNGSTHTSEEESEPMEAPLEEPATSVTRSLSVGASTSPAASESTAPAAPVPTISVPSSSTKRPRSPPEENIAPTVPVTIPTTTPREFGESSRRTKIRRTARKTVGHFVNRPLARRTESSDSTRDIPCDVQTPRLPDPEPLEWMTTLLHRWRTYADLPTTYVSHAPITGEPIELTVPTLVGVCSNTLQMMADRHRDILDLGRDSTILDRDVTAIYNRLEIVEVRIAEDAETARNRMDAIEARQRTMSLVMNTAIGWFVIKTIVGMFFPYLM